MDTVARLHEISLRLDHIEAAGDWIARALIQSDAGASQTGTLVGVLAEEVREQVFELVNELEHSLLLPDADTPLH